MPKQQRYILNENAAAVRIAVLARIIAAAMELGPTRICVRLVCGAGQAPDIQRLKQFKDSEGRRKEGRVPVPPPT